MKSLKAVRSKFVVAFMVDKMDIPSRLSLLIAIVGLGCQFLSTLLGGVNHFVGSSVIPHVAAILSITSSVFILILCVVVVQGFMLRNYLVKRRTAKKSALQSSGSI
ncbi:hypothetical protein R7D97_16630 [Vibrio sp. Vb5031]|uniref:Uncharacterized protein n=1 Tax=Vibrio hepatarius TaxID=171383 RepID=A0A0M0HZ47_9VIBR|nr:MULTISPECIES: hypothetical protein [Vibrio]KOO06913.1 hypothetical protein AKJ31_14525 [Vibrio hepatarius]MDW1505811.1 hypothetical protein [Vibrio sp. Vb5031]MDW2456271.1 hypothetical protein [Vibrio sp. 1249-1]